MGTTGNDYVLKETDFYRHIIDETTLQLAPRKDYKVSLSMIVKNEEATIEQTLESIKDFVDEIVVVDTGSTDKTKEIVQKYTKFLYNYTWNDSFSDARNLALSKCTGDWILRLDGDEVFPEEAILPIWEFIQNDEADIILFSINNYLEDPTKGDNPKIAVSKTARLFKNLEGIKFSGRVHEEIDSSIELLSKSQRIRVITSPVRLQHFGYLKDKKELSSKYEYYAHLSTLDIKENPKNYKPYFNLANHYMHTNRMVEAEQYYRKVLELNPTMYMAWHELGVILYKSAVKKVEDLLTEAKTCFVKCKENIPEEEQEHKGQLQTNLNGVDRLLKLSKSE